MTVQAVFFDMGGTIETLFYDDKLRLAATAQLRQQLAERGLDPGLTTEALYQVIKTGLRRYTDWKEDSLIELESSRIWQEYIFAGLNLPPTTLAAASERLSYFYETRFYKREMRPEVPAILQAIREMGLKIGCISNVMSQGLVPDLLRRYGIADFFSPVVLSSVFGRRKPDPAIFLHAAQLAGAPPGACVHIGDTISRDVLGARRAGYRLAIRIEHAPLGGRRSQEAVPDFVLKDMSQLLQVLEDEMTRSGAWATAAKPPKNKIEALLFDAGDLLYHRPHKGERWAAFLAELDLRSSRVPRRERDELRAQAFVGQISRREYHERILRLHGIDAEQDLGRGRQVLEQESDDVCFFDGVKETLIALKEQGLRLGIVTDTFQPEAVKRRWLEREGIGHVWDVFVSSYKVGVCKPEPRIYQIALEELGVEPQAAAFVGHKASELDGAKAVGMTTVAFNRDEDAHADFCIERFSQLQDLRILSQGEREK